MENSARRPRPENLEERWMYPRGTINPQGGLSWLREHFVTWRGTACFDNPDEHRRLFGNQFLSKRKK